MKFVLYLLTLIERLGLINLVQGARKRDSNRARLLGNRGKIATEMPRGTSSWEHARIAAGLLSGGRWRSLNRAGCRMVERSFLTHSLWYRRWLLDCARTGQPRVRKLYSGYFSGSITFKSKYGVSMAKARIVHFHPLLFGT